jgi:hypothetical protein
LHHRQPPRRRNVSSKSAATRFTAIRSRRRVQRQRIFQARRKSPHRHNYWKKFEANLSIHAIQHGNRQFILERWEAGKRKRKTWIAEHGTWITELFPNNKKGETFWLCLYCGQMFASAATTGAIAHLNNKSNDLHRVKAPNRQKSPSPPPPAAGGQRSIVSLFASQAARASSDVMLQSEIEIVERSISRWVVIGNYPFTIVESKDLRRALVVLNSEKTEKLFPKSASTIRRLVDQLYEEELVVMKQVLALTPHKVHLSFDLWTSPNRMALLGIVAHFLDNGKNYRHDFLDCREFSASTVVPTRQNP